MTILKFIKDHLIGSILISITLGVIVGNYFNVTSLKNLILPLTFLLVYPMLVTLDFASLKEKANYKLQITTQLLNFIVFPSIAFLVGFLFFKDQTYIRLGLLLIGLLPTSGMTISWTVMAKGNIHEAIRMVVIGLLIGAFLTPFYITFFLGTEIDVPILDIIVQILIVIFIPLIAAFLTQKGLVSRYGEQTFKQKIKPIFPLFSTFFVVIILFVAMSLKAKVLVENPMLLLDILLPLLLFYFLMFIVSVATARIFFNRADGIAMVNGTLIRNLSLSLVIVLSTFPDAGIAALLIAIAYVIQVQIAAWNVKATRYLFKPETTT